MTEEKQIPEIIYIEHNNLIYLNDMKDILGWSYIKNVFISLKDGCLTHEAYILKSKYDELMERLKRLEYERSQLKKQLIRSEILINKPIDMTEEQLKLKEIIDKNVKLFNDLRDESNLHELKRKIDIEFCGLPSVARNMIQVFAKQYSDSVNAEQIAKNKQLEKTSYTVSKDYMDLTKKNAELKKEIERLKGDNERLKEFSEYNPVDDNSLLCDVEGCNMGPVSGGIYWRENGYWHLCSAHSFLGLEGEPMPQMKQSSIDREGRRDQYGVLR